MIAQNTAPATPADEKVVSLDIPSPAQQSQKQEQATPRPEAQATPAADI